MPNEIQDLEYSFHSKRGTEDELGNDGISVRHMLIIQAISGLVSGPLAVRFANDPQQLGAFAASIADGVELTVFDPAVLGAKQASSQTTN